MNPGHLGDWTLEEFLTYWPDPVVQGRAASEDLQRYEGVVRRYLIPELGKRWLGKAQAQAVLDAAYEEWPYALHVLAICLSLRRGELLGLRWADIDLDAGLRQGAIA